MWTNWKLQCFMQQVLDRHSDTRTGFRQMEIDWFYLLRCTLRSMLTVSVRFQVRFFHSPPRLWIARWIQQRNTKTVFRLARANCRFQLTTRYHSIYAEMINNCLSPVRNRKKTRWKINRNNSQSIQFVFEFILQQIGRQLSYFLIIYFNAGVINPINYLPG